MQILSIIKISHIYRPKTLKDNNTNNNSAKQLLQQQCEKMRRLFDLYENVSQKIMCKIFRRTFSNISKSNILHTLAIDVIVIRHIRYMYTILCTYEAYTWLLSLYRVVDKQNCAKKVARTETFKKMTETVEQIVIASQHLSQSISETMAASITEHN